VYRFVIVDAPKPMFKECQVGHVNFPQKSRDSTTLALLCDRDLRSVARSTLENTFSDNGGSNEEGALTLCDLTLHCTWCCALSWKLHRRCHREGKLCVIEVTKKLQTWNLKF